jgi:hypothetical protein
MLLVDLVIPPEVVDDFTHAFRHRRIDATHHERALDFFRQSTPSGDSRFRVGGRKLAVCDGSEVKLDEDEHATGAQDAG